MIFKSNNQKYLPRSFWRTERSLYRRRKFYCKATHTWSAERNDAARHMTSVRARMRSQLFVWSLPSLDILLPMPNGPARSLKRHSVGVGKSGNAEFYNGSSFELPYMYCYDVTIFVACHTSDLCIAIIVHFSARVSQLQRIESTLVFDINISQGRATRLSCGGIFSDRALLQIIYCRICQWNQIFSVQLAAVKGLLQTKRTNGTGVASYDISAITMVYKRRYMCSIFSSVVVACTNIASAIPLLQAFPWHMYDILRI